MVEWFYGLPMAALYPATVVLIAGASVIGDWLGRRSRGNTGSEFGTLTGAALGLLAPLLALTFSIAVSRYDSRRGVVLEEANAIGSTANYALMLPQRVQAPILGLLRDYTAVQIGLGVPYGTAKLEGDIDKSADLLDRLWQQAVAVTAEAPQSLPAYRFVASLNEVNNIDEKRLVALRYHVPAAVMVMLIGISMVAMGFTGYHAAFSRGGRRIAVLLMSVTVSVLIMLVIDLDRPERGLIEVPVQPLIDAARGIPG